IEGDISDLIRERIRKQNGTFNCNDNISEYLLEGELEELQKEVEKKFQDVLNSLVIDTDNDYNTQDTARRVAKMFINEVFSGRYY
ncbi:GTP cyclohydrolase I, partial [Tritonibacter sp. SIMBA_163]